MAVAPFTHVVGAFTRGMDYASTLFAKLVKLQRGLESLPLADLLAQGMLFEIPFEIQTTVAASETKNSVRWVAPQNVTLLCVSMGCETSSGSAATGDIWTDDGTTDATALAAAVNIHAGLTTPAARAAFVTTKVDVDQGSEVYFQVVSTGGNVVGPKARVFAQWRTQT
jgi:hypothetical protein